MNAFELPEETHFGHVHLRTANLARIVDFYRRVIGLKVIGQSGNQASLSATGHTPALLLFTEDKKAAPRSRPTTGLYHFAIRYPTRPDLAQALRQLFVMDQPITGASDHGVAESIYLDDPDGNGVELSCDRPRSPWQMDSGNIQMRRRLDLAGLLETAEKVTNPGLSPLTDIGHINLHVRDLGEAIKFFHNFLGLKITAQVRGAVFLSAGAYHHHMAVNNWGGKKTAAKNSVGLMAYGLSIPIPATLLSLKDRAQDFGYEVKKAGDILQIRDPNDHWLELEADRDIANLSALKGWQS
jgi:catechol 2,3-dioxygenase